MIINSAEESGASLSLDIGNIDIGLVRICHLVNFYVIALHITLYFYIKSQKSRQTRYTIFRENPI